MERSLGECTVLVDMDGVLFDFETPNNDIVRGYGIEPVVGRTDFYYADTYRDHPDLLALIYRENRREGFFRSFPLVEHAIEGWQRMLEAGFNPRVCSSPLEDHPTCIAEKQSSLEEYFVPHFGYKIIDQVIFDRNKSGYNACAMIDDRPELRGQERARWQHVAFDRSYNAHSKVPFRLHGWHDPALETILDACRLLYTESHEKPMLH